MYRITSLVYIQHKKKHNNAITQDTDILILLSNGPISCSDYWIHQVAHRDTVIYKAVIYSIFGSRVSQLVFSMASSTRHRFQPKTPDLKQSEASKVNALEIKPSIIQLRFNLFHWLIILCLYSFIVYYVHRVQTKYPTPLDLGGDNKGRFIEASARSYLQGITKFGPRPVGSHENEVLTVEYLLNAISEIQQKANVVHKIEVDSRRTSGSFSIDFLGGFTSVYDNVNNILVKFSPRSGASDSFLINCHYDTVINVTGDCCALFTL